MIKENKKIRVGSRGSPLALAQIDEVRALLKKKAGAVSFELTAFQTGGDKDKVTPLSANVADDFFTDTIDQALLDGRIDVAVHSAKDLPRALRDGLSVFALTKAVDDTDAFVGNVHFKDLPKGSRVGTSSPLRQSAVTELNPRVRTVQIRGTIQERIQLLEQGKCDGIIVATAALKRLGLERKIKDIMPWEATALQGQLAVVGRSADHHLRGFFSAIDARKGYGTVTLVGAGPGDPELITLKGVRALKDADVIFYDYLAHPDILDHAPKAEKINVGKRKGKHSLPQAELCRMLKSHALKGENVVRLKGGDPLIFGRGAEEISYLRSYHIQVDVIPGVSSATAIPSSLEIPLTARDVSSSVAFVSGHSKDEHDGDPRPVRIPDVDTIVFLMGLTKLKEIVSALAKAGWSNTTPVAVVSRGTYEDERVVIASLQDVIERAGKENLRHPVLIIVGEVVRLRKDIQSKSKILYTGTNPEAYGHLGDIIHFPMITISGARLKADDIKRIVQALKGSDAVLFTSRFAVRYFFKILKKKGKGAPALAGKKVFVIGEETARELRRSGLKEDIVAEVETSEGMFSAITKHYDVKGKTVLFPRSSLPNPFLKKELARLGAKVREFTVYENTKPRKRELPSNGIGKVIFTSPSTVRNFLKDHAKIPQGWGIYSRGAKTSRFLKEAGYKDIFVIKKGNIDG